ncbi:hypothetical protein GCG54_00007391 [Colletotrichum gloeosporioides]|uniref:DUF5672 domain-containing protein n=2 Tax=Colletotrichum gloeosporioides TaxID=474922 RepID=T0KNG5_COLGC|nr:uncharacterized protein GCG54_00007391 [Colletotrichum gloeosporioides]EQB57282.1 hypothetical protein CGLO_02615 [Colletotrichum gloeosporioides Cg-14]KAF3807658.1 hypothetical protein GCG54_00007391 [Colletotrichum gloeosporioides]
MALPPQPDTNMADVKQQVKVLLLSLWALTSRRMRVAGAFVLFLGVSVWLSLPTIKTMAVPKVTLEYAHSPYNHSKVALLVENRPNPILAPLMLHFISVVPPDWRFRFMGSIDSVRSINQSVAIREQVAAGKLDLTYIPSNMSTAGQEMISRFLTNLWLYETVLQPAEWLLVFQTDSILCANNRQNINDYLEYDWIGAPWNPGGRWGGNGGLSIRRVSAMIDILRNQKRVDGSEPEDVWLAERLAHRPGSKVANGTVSLMFSGEMHTGPGTVINHDGPNSTLEAAAEGELVAGIDDYREGYYEPMGYHTGGSGIWLHSAIWGTPALRKHIWDYCPEVKLTLAMDAAKYVPGTCKSNWKRGIDIYEDGGLVEREEEISEEEALSAYPFGTEMIDGEEYPKLPPNLMMW